MFKNITRAVVADLGKRVASFVAVNAAAGVIQTVVATATSNYLSRRQPNTDK